MAVDYDLIVVGSTPTAICAVTLAAHLKARVALVQHSDFGDLVDPKIVQQVGQLRQCHHHLQDWNLQQPSLPDTRVNWLQMQRFADTARSVMADYQSPARLSTLGIEVIPGRGEFCRKPAVGLRVGHRLLRSRAYLLALPAIPLIPTIAGLAAGRYITAATLLSKGYSLLQHSSTVTILGADPIGVELAQSLTNLGKQVQLIVPSPRILPLEDPEAAYLVQAKLEAEGIHLLTHATLRGIDQNPDGQQLYLTGPGKRTVTTDVLVLATGWGYDLAPLNLDAIGVAWEGHHLQVNAKLQTSNPQVYAAMPPRSNHPATHSPIDLARTAVKNALFFPRLQVQDVAPRVVKTSPEFASVGLTEPQVQEHFAEQSVEIVQRSFHPPLLETESLGFCKLLVKPDGRLLGAALVGPQAGTAIGAIALALQRHLPVRALATAIFPPSTLGELIAYTAQDWQRHRLKRRPWQQNWLQAWFDWQRGRSS